jgi:aldehyde dehydrogenase (NAD+)
MTGFETKEGIWMDQLVATRRPFIDGAPVSGGGPPIAVESPATGDVVCEVEGASPEQVDTAVAAARRAFDDGPWPRMDPAERIRTIRDLGRALREREDVLVETVIAEAGCPRSVTKDHQVGLALASLSELCDLYERLPDWEHTEAPLSDYMVGSNVRLSIRRFAPSGVVAAITPYNFPFITNIWKVVPALLTGCTVVLRPSPLTPLSATIFGEVAQEVGLPTGVLNVVPEGGHHGGTILSRHRDVDVVSFTGSTTVGRQIAAQGAPTLKRMILELGGKSVQLHLPDTFEDGGVGDTVSASLAVFAAHAGQGCALQTRLLVPQECRARVVDAVAAVAKTLPIGDPSAPSTLVGPLITSAHRDRVNDIVQASVRSGATLVTGGRVPDAAERGWFYAPTLLVAASRDDPSAQREIFGPVITVLGYEDLDDAVDIANATELGLSGAIYTNDLRLGLSLSTRLRSGTVQINTGWAAGYTPMGGMKQSGYGRERGSAGIRAFQELQHVVVGSR